MLNMGVVGYGYCGPNVDRNFQGTAGAKLVAISDLSEKRLGLAQNHYPFIKGMKDPLELIRSTYVDAVAIVTPVFAHYEMAKAALLAGKHIFVEKPFTSTSAQARELLDLAAKKNLKIMVDHTFLFTGAVRRPSGASTRAYSAESQAAAIDSGGSPAFGAKGHNSMAITARAANFPLGSSRRPRPAPAARSTDPHGAAAAHSVDVRG